nr:TPA_asm: M [Lycium betacytorhabdovirus 1]
MLRLGESHKDVDVTESPDKNVDIDNLNSRKIGKSTSLNISSDHHPVDINKKSNFEFVRSENLKINYCGIFSTISGSIVGRDKDMLIMNYKEIIERSIDMALKSERDVIDVNCKSSILTTIICEHISNQRVSETMRYIPSHFLLGDSVWELKITCPSTLVTRVRYLPRDESQYSLKIKENVIEDNKVNYLLNITGEFIMWKVPEVLAYQLYISNKTTLRPGTLLNEPTDDVTVVRLPADVNEEEEIDYSSSLTLRGLSEEKKILNNLFSNNDPNRLGNNKATSSKIK